MNNLTTCNCKGCDLLDIMFSKTSESEKDLICQSKHEIAFPQGKQIINQDDEIKEFMYLKSGLVKVYKKGDNNKDQIVKIACPLDFISLLSSFSSTHSPFSVTALEDSVVCFVDLQVFKQLIVNNGSLALDLLERMSKTSNDIITTNLEMGKKNLHGRIAYVLLYFSKSVYQNKVFDLPVSRKEIAEFIEMTTENVIRTLSEFKKDNILKINGKTIEICDEKRLERICEFG